VGMYEELINFRWVNLSKFLPEREFIELILINHSLLLRTLNTQHSMFNDHWGIGNETFT